ncbi:MAG TPA: hypothetical protein ENJ35_11185 [Gammaproteobacteria bacterium]|nr:hypothetical protein [Gammaproteobacteria bacterium]
MTATKEDGLLDAQDRFDNQMYYARSIMDLVADLHDSESDVSHSSLKGACIAAVEHLDEADKAAKCLFAEAKTIQQVGSTKVEGQS